MRATSFLGNVEGMIEKRTGKDLKQSCVRSFQTLLPQQTPAGGNTAFSTYGSGLRLEIKHILFRLGHPGGDGNCSVSFALGQAATRALFTSCNSISPSKLFWQTEKHREKSSAKLTSLQPNTKENFRPKTSPQETRSSPSLPGWLRKQLHFEKPRSPRTPR